MDWASEAAGARYRPAGPPFAAVPCTAADLPCRGGAGRRGWNGGRGGRPNAVFPPASRRRAGAGRQQRRASRSAAASPPPHPRLDVAAARPGPDARRNPCALCSTNIPHSSAHGAPGPAKAKAVRAPQREGAPGPIKWKCTQRPLTFATGSVRAGDAIPSSPPSPAQGTEGRRGSECAPARRERSSPGAQHGRKRRGAGRTRRHES